MNLAFAAIMNRPRYLLDSIIARKVSASAFLHSLDPEHTFGLVYLNWYMPGSRGFCMRLNESLRHAIYVAGTEPHLSHSGPKLGWIDIGVVAKL